MSVDQTARVEHGRRAAEEWLASAPPVPTAEELARPFLVGIRRLCELETEECVFDELSCEGNSALGARAFELARNIRQAADLCASFAENCTVGRAGPAAAGVAMREVIVRVGNVDSLVYADQAQCWDILECQS